MVTTCTAGDLSRRLSDEQCDNALRLVAGQGTYEYMAVHVIYVVRVHVQLDSTPQIPTMNTFSTLGNCSVTVSDLDLLRILFHGDSISREYEARYPFNQKLGIIYTLHRGRQFSYSRFSETET